MRTILIIMYLSILLIFYIRIIKLTKENNELHKVINDTYKALLPLKKELEKQIGKGE